MEISLLAWNSNVPVWIVFVFTIAVCVVALEVGVWLATHTLRHKSEGEPEAPLGSLVGAMLGLLAFMLAFTFGIAAERFDTRKQLVLDEANAIQTAYLRASLMPSAHGEEVRRLLKDYAEMRLETTFADYLAMLDDSEKIQRQLWAQVELVAKQDVDSELRSLFTASINDLINVHQSRRTFRLEYQIPGMVWVVLYMLTALTMVSVGYQVRMSGTRRLRGMPVMVTAFALVILMIADLDTPGRGFLNVTRAPIADVLQMMDHDSQ
jgi:hypothetical protein